MSDSEILTKPSVEFIEAPASQPEIVSLDDLPIISAATMLPSGEIKVEKFITMEPSYVKPEGNFEDDPDKWHKSIDRDGRECYRSERFSYIVKDENGEETEVYRIFYKDDPQDRQELIEYGVEL